MDLISLFRRSTNDKHFIPEIDGLRFFAIATVMLFHLNTVYVESLGLELRDWRNSMGDAHWGEAAWWVIRMDVGVKVFFAISGFILALPFLRQYSLGGRSVALKDYFIRRLTRLEPPFVLSLSGFFLVHLIILNTSYQDLWPHFLAGLCYAHVFIYGVPNPINPVTWSLETEAQFYLVLPLVAALVFLLHSVWWRVVVLLVLMGSSIFARYWFFTEHISQFSGSILAYLSNFLIGCIFAAWYLHRQDLFKQRGRVVFDLLGVASILVMFQWYKPQAYFLNNILLNLSIFGLFLAAFRGLLFRWFFTRPWVYLLGGMCYTLYLLHYAFYHLLVPYTARYSLGQGYWPDLGLQTLLVLPPFLLVAAGFYLLIEKPCMRKDWPMQLFKRLMGLASFKYRN